MILIPVLLFAVDEVDPTFQKLSTLKPVMPLMSYIFCLAQEGILSILSF